MEVIFNDQYSYPITFARESYEIGKGRNFSITLIYSNELMDELEDFFEKTKILNIKILNGLKEEIYFTDKFINVERIYYNMNRDNTTSSLIVDFSKRSDNE